MAIARTLAVKLHWMLRYADRNAQPVRMSGNPSSGVVPMVGSRECLVRLASRHEAGSLKYESWWQDRRDGWWDLNPPQDSRRRAWVEEEPKDSAKQESAKDEAQMKALGFVPDLILGVPGAASRVEINAPTQIVGAPFTPRPARKGSCVS